MPVQSTWKTAIETFDLFDDQAREKPDAVFLVGKRPCFPNALTLSAVSEERVCFWVEGSTGWRARVIRRCRAMGPATPPLTQSRHEVVRRPRSRAGAKLIIFREK
jgi:hypothetical protein